MIISIEGCDRSGKDSLMLAYDKATKWDHTNIMRGPVGCIVYDRHYQRDTPERNLEHYEDISAIKSVPHLVIYMKADEETIVERLKEEGNTIDSILPPGVASYHDLSREYYAEICKNYDAENILVINSSEKTIEEEVQLVKDKVEYIKSCPIQVAIDPKARDIASRNKGNFAYTQFQPIQRMYTDDKLRSFDEFDKSVDPIYYDMVEACLTHKLYERDLGWINDRQMVYTSDDCISMIQLVPFYDGVNKEPVFYNIFAHQRSCDICKHKTNDLTFYLYFMEKHCPDVPFNLYYTCAVPHTYEKITRVI